MIVARIGPSYPAASGEMLKTHGPQAEPGNISTLDPKEAARKGEFSLYFGLIFAGQAGRVERRGSSGGGNLPGPRDFGIHEIEPLVELWVPARSSELSFPLLEILGLFLGPIVVHALSIGRRA